MARFKYPWKKVLLCACTVVAILVLLLIFLAKMKCKNVNGAALSLTAREESESEIPFQLWRKKKFARLPKVFWQNHLLGDAFWNKHQVTIDYHFNPILSPHNSNIDFNSLFYESILRQSFSDVSGLVGTIDLPQMLQDFVSSMQKRDYPTLIEPGGLCGAGALDEKEPPLLLLAIKSTEANFKNRQAIRETWGQSGWVSGKSSKGEERGGYVRRIFLLGREKGKMQSPELVAESTLYGDILQWDFVDTFFNLTLKDVLLWKWVSHYCSQVRFVFKGDNDVFVNTVKMITYLQEQLKKPQAEKQMEDFMVGYIIGGTSPIRDDTSKYFIPDSFYKGLYPVYACGGGVVYSGALAKRLHQVSKRVHLFPIDDAYVGMCMSRLNILPIHHPAFLIYDFPGKDEEEECSYHKMLMVHKRSPSQMTEKWAHVKKTEEQCWDSPLRDVYIPQHLLPISQ